MDFLWGGTLLSLGLIPLLVALYVWVLRRRRRFAVRYSSLSLVREALPRSSPLRRHLPFALFLIAMASGLVAFARPVATVLVPTGRAIVVLAMDVSGSMRETDIPPNRLAAAKSAAQSFVQRQPPNTHIGIVAFGGFAEMILAPTANQEELQAAVASLRYSRGTAIGSAILKSLEVIADPDAAEARTARDPSQAAPLLSGESVPAIIVLLTDGVNTTGPLPLDAAQQAVDRGVRIYTVGFGSEDGSGPFGPSRQGGNWGRRELDEETLRQVAEMTGGEYYRAESAGELVVVFERLPTTFTRIEKTTELSVVFAALGALFTAIAVALSLIWHPLP